MHDRAPPGQTMVQQTLQEACSREQATFSQWTVAEVSRTGKVGRIQKIPAYDGRKLGSAILESGGALACVPADLLHVLNDLRAESYKFFQMTEVAKLRHATTDHSQGFRPFKSQYSRSPDRPDLNESFAVWASSIEEIPFNADLKGFADSILAYREIVAKIAQHALDAICEHYNTCHYFRFQRNSCLEVNWYQTKESRALLQDKHEDGHLLTLLTADAPGLEVEINNVMFPVTFGPGEILLMPGSLLTDMTGGNILPMYHQVRNHNVFPRVSYLYQVNPEVTSTLRPFVYTEQNVNVDFRARVLAVGQSFGLPPAPFNLEDMA